MPEVNQTLLVNVELRPKLDPDVKDQPLLEVTAGNINRLASMRFPTPIKYLDQ
jgi:hypothetical protein